MRYLRIPRARARALAFAGLAAFSLLGPGKEAPLHAQSAAWVGQVIARYNYEHHADFDFSQLGTTAYEVILEDGTPIVSAGGWMSTKWSAAWHDTRNYYSDSCGLRSVSRYLKAYGFGEGENTTLRVTYLSSSSHGAGYEINGRAEGISFEILTEHRARYGACLWNDAAYTSSTSGGQSVLAFVPSAANDRWVITGTFPRSPGAINSCIGFTCQENTVTVRLRRANCTGAPDEDGDGLNTCQEFDYRTDPLKRDTDGGGVEDGDEVLSGTDPHNPEDDDPDPDFDGIPTQAPDNCPTLYNPDQADLDGDGQGDVCDPDRDGDGLDNATELTKGTNPDDPDTDDDTVRDGTDQCPLKPGLPPTGCSGGKLTVMLGADYQTYWVGGRKVIIKGASSMTVTGDATAVSLVQGVCLDLKWDAYLKKTRDSGRAQWSEGPQLITGGIIPHALWQELPSGTGSWISTLYSEGRLCLPGLSVQYSTYEAGRVDLVAETYTALLTMLAHHLDGTIVLTDGRTLTCRSPSPETERAPQKGSGVKDFDHAWVCDLVV